MSSYKPIFAPSFDVDQYAEQADPEPELEYKQVATVETETDSKAPGSFVALVSTWETDRQNERILPGAFKASLEEWRASGQRIPVMADHGGEIHTVVGHVDPRMTTETEQGLEAAGVLDTSTELGKRTYALVKQASLRWSIGFVVPEGGRRKRGKVTEISQVDLAEISAVPVPANRGTRTLSIKSHRPIQIASFPC